MANITKISGVVKVTPTGGQPFMYFGPIGTIKTQGNNIYLKVNNDEYIFPYTDLTVNGQIPSSLTTAMTLLNSIFGT